MTSPLDPEAKTKLQDCSARSRQPEAWRPSCGRSAGQEWSGAWGSFCKMGGQLEEGGGPREVRQGTSPVSRGRAFSAMGNRVEKALPVS